MSESDAPNTHPDEDYAGHDKTSTAAVKADEEQAKQEESGQENPT